MIRLKSVVVGVGFVVALAGCAGPALKDSEFCRSTTVRTFEKSDGPSTPLAIKMLGDQTVVIQYVATWNAGAIGFEIWDDAGIPIWSAQAQKTTTAQTIKSKKLTPGNYRLVTVAEDATDGTVCVVQTLE